MSDTLRLVTTRVEVIRPLRHTVLRAGMPPWAAVFEGDEEPTALHLAALEGRAVCGCVTLIRRAYEGRPAWQLRGMAVAEDRRHTGLGGRLLRFAERSMRDRATLDTAWCNARVPAVRFYERHGWRAVSEVFDVPTAGPHRRLVRDLRGP